MDPEDVPPELGDLAEALTCPICKGLFDGPVSPPCGHTFCSMCIRQSLDFAHANKQKGTCPSCRADCNADQLRRVDALRVVSTVLPDVALAVHNLKGRLEEYERRLQQAEQQLAAAQGHSGAAATPAGGAAAAACSRGASARPGGRSSLQPAEGPTGAVEGRPRRGVAQQQASQPSARSTRQAARQAPDGRSCKRRAVGDTGARQAAGGGGAGEDGRDDDASDFAAVSGRSDQQSDEDPGFELASEEEQEEEEDVYSDGDEDYSPSGRNKGRRQSSAAAGAGPAVGSRKRGRPSSVAAAAAATAAAHQPHRGAGRARASGSAPPEVSAPVPAPAHAPAPQDGMGDCPLCGHRYSLAQLQAHVDICLTRQSARAGGAAGSSGAAVPSVRGPSPGPAAVAGSAKAGPLARTFAAGTGVGVGAAAAVGVGRGRPGSAGGAAGGGSSSGGAAAQPARPPTDVKVPPAQVWHSMTDKAARKVMGSHGLPVTGDKNDWSARYNRYRTFLRTEKDRCTIQTMDQLLRAFLQKELQEDAGRRQPAAAPSWMLNQIREAAERMKVAQRSQQAVAAQRARSASAAGLHDDGGATGADDAAAAAPPDAEPGGEALTAATPAALTTGSPRPQMTNDGPGAAAASLAAAVAPVAPFTSTAPPLPAAAAAVPGLPGRVDHDVIMIGSDSEEDVKPGQPGAATAVPRQPAGGPSSWLGPRAATPGNGGPEPGAHEPRRLAPAGEADMPGGYTAPAAAAEGSSDAVITAGADAAGAFGGDGMLQGLPVQGQGPVFESPHSEWPGGQHGGGQQQHLQADGRQPSEQQAQGQGQEQGRGQEQEDAEEANTPLPPPRPSQWMRAGSPPPGADDDAPATAQLPAASGSWGLPWALDYGGRGTASAAAAVAASGIGKDTAGNDNGADMSLGGGGWLADISNGTGSQRQARPSLQLAGEAALPAGKALAAAAAWNAQRREAVDVASEQQYE
ncbi:hypothetical protein HYH02_001646 [Chlamydomonas schloesseri]|uniref:RING-type domain-containing protein n=1 Tax=Chlamydomonas schloesseri TaxID=2026947 RepID=A0A835WUB3_9CHLO|nr:hypothetical protein HYH02_001646 [Chlamydomonas schloesseri]|eukprot:KAG2453423.1 hypothetical protein HYH02_001646 [Chlamydomonas schloesseri]